MATLSTTRFSNRHAASSAYGLEVVVRHATWSWLPTRVAAFIERCIDAYRARRAVTCLDATAMSDRELRDIGLRRTDVEYGSRWDALTEIARFDRI